MGIFKKLNGPVFYKDSNSSVQQMEKLKELCESASGNEKMKMEQDIRMLSYGIVGEENLAFELMNSYMPMIILRDIYYEHEGLTGQIDYIVITRKLKFIIECKNLFGNIEVNRSGDFIRTIEFNGFKKREGIYSPVTQNQRHMDLLRKMKRDNKANVIAKFLVDKFFEDNYRSIVVLANPKTVIDMKYAKKEVKSKIIRSDQLVAYIKKNEF